MENAYIIKGGKPLSGEVTLSGAKNVALKIVIASLMFEGDVILHNIPRINDIHELLHLIQLLGGKADFVEGNTVQVSGGSIKKNKVDLLHASKIRASFLLFAPLLRLFEEAHIPNPGGCRIGARSIDRIVEGMKAVGIAVEYDSSAGYYIAQLKQTVKGNFTFGKSTHTGTELMILIGMLSTERIVIHNAALEPEIDDLIKFLNDGGAEIVREDRKITIVGAKKLKQKKPFTIVCDRNEAVTYAISAIVTKGEITFSGIAQEHFTEFIAKINQAHGGVEYMGHSRWRFFATDQLRATDVTTGPHPEFMTDWQPPWAILMTQAVGESIIHERVYENRFSYVEELRKMGASIEYVHRSVHRPEQFYTFNYNPLHSYKQIIKIKGPQKLHNGVVTIADLRAGVTLAIAALLAKGESVVYGASNVERGYEDFVGKITSLGGNIKKI